MLCSKMVKNAHLACSEAFDVQLKNDRPLELVDDVSPHPEKGVCHLQGLTRTSVTVDALPFGQIWLGLSYKFGGQAYSWAGLQESIWHPVCSSVDVCSDEGISAVTWARAASSFYHQKINQS